MSSHSQMDVKNPWNNTTARPRLVETSIKEIPLEDHPKGKVTHIPRSFGGGIKNSILCKFERPKRQQELIPEEQDKFSSCPGFRGVYVPPVRGKDQNKMRQFGFVRFDNEKNAEMAMQQMSGQTICERPIKLILTKTRQEILTICQTQSEAREGQSWKDQEVQRIRDLFPDLDLGALPSNIIDMQSDLSDKYPNDVEEVLDLRTGFEKVDDLKQQETDSRQHIRDRGSLLRSMANIPERAKELAVYFRSFPRLVPMRWRRPDPLEKRLKCFRNWIIHVMDGPYRIFAPIEQIHYFIFTDFEPMMENARLEESELDRRFQKMIRDYQTTCVGALAED
ncbi:hypothetical protein DL98DRAFT_585192 [Cadophora sp. DSE1049]|nr:hypothetical protein DL98DRAFT_585192 [Cadophora sp. DSE1049]